MMTFSNETWPPLTEADWRYEVKLVCPMPKLAAARTWVRQHPERLRVAYPPRLVNSLYLDTPTLNGLAANVAGVSERQKLRLRWYGAAAERVVAPTLELKFKRNMVGGKQREKLDWTLDWKRPYATLLPALRRAATPKWRRWLGGGLEAVLINQYRREYYVSPDGELRVTLDFEQRAYDQRLSPRPNRQRRVLLPDTAVIEVKAPVAQAERIEQAMSFFPLPRLRHSKYANGVLGSL